MAQIVPGGSLPYPSELASETPFFPLLCFHNGSQMLCLPVAGVEVACEVHVATAFCNLKLHFVNSANYEIKGLFVLPLRGTVTSSVIQIGLNYFKLFFKDRGKIHVSNSRYSN